MTNIVTYESAQMNLRSERDKQSSLWHFVASTGYTREPQIYEPVSKIEKVYFEPFN